MLVLCDSVRPGKPQFKLIFRLLNDEIIISAGFKIVPDMLKVQRNLVISDVCHLFPKSRTIML